MQPGSSDTSLSMTLKCQPQLYDLHTHLLGMGNAGFWIDSIIMDPRIMPTNKTFKKHKTIRHDLCPLIWDKDDKTPIDSTVHRDLYYPLIWGQGEKTTPTGFVDGHEAANFFRYLRRGKILPTTGKLDDVVTEMKQKFSSTLCNLIDKKLNSELINRKLTFQKDFSYDVVLKLTDLSHALRVKQTDIQDFVQLAVAEKLGVYSPRKKAKVHFRHWIIFNAREQKFEVAYGIRIEDLRYLVKFNLYGPSEAQKAARAHLINAFSMCDPQGTPARHVDLHGFQGSFTPEFYPQRFALKDSIYSQRLDVLAALIAHVIERYTTCLPPVRYCEFSISIRDLSQPWIFDVLRSVRIYNWKDNTPHLRMDLEKKTLIADENSSSFSQMIRNGHFPHLKFAFMGPVSNNTSDFSSTTSHFTYKFLAGFDRRKIKLFANQKKEEKKNLDKESEKALRFLHDYPQEAILFMMKEIIKSKNNGQNSEQMHTTSTTMTNTEPFSDFLEKLNNMDLKSKVMPSFYNWVVGLDLFGDELGYPYCPFVARPFINFIRYRREHGGNKHFGVRIHCGENVSYAEEDAPAYRSFIAHMYIVFRYLRFLKEELEYGIRIGHGIAFDRILNRTLYEELQHRKSSVLRAEMRHQATFLLKTIAFEVNITSNEYLLGQTLRQGDCVKTLSLDTLVELGAPIILATDDDGIWPINQCASTHPGHQSLSAEYCRAISSSLINSTEQLEKVFTDTKNFCFSNTGGEMPKPREDEMLPSNGPLLNNIIIHPDIIRRIRCLYDSKSIEINPAFDSFTVDPKLPHIDWNDEYGALRVAFICVCANHDPASQDCISHMKKIHDEYYVLFPKDDGGKEFEAIYKNWMSIRSKYVFPHDDKSSKKIGHDVLLENYNKSGHRVYSAPQQDNLDAPTHKALLKYLKSIKWLKVTVHAYVPHIDKDKTLKKMTKRRRIADVTKEYDGMTLLLYTNRDKYTYIYHEFDGEFKLEVNPHSSKREKTDQNFLYALCPYASAATFALHFISQQLTEQYKNPSKPTPGNRANVVLGNTIRVPTEELVRVPPILPVRGTPLSDLMPDTTYTSLCPKASSSNSDTNNVN